MKKLLALFLTLCMVLALAACGGKPQEDSKEPDVSDKSDVEPVTISIYSNYTEAITQPEGIAYRELVQQFQKDNTDIKIEIEEIPHDLYLTKLQTAAAGDELPTIFACLPTVASSLYKSGLLHTLNEDLDADPAWRDSFIDGAFSDQTALDGKIMGMPYTTLLSHILYTNMDILKKCGIQEFPKTMEEFKQMIPKIKENGYVPVAMGNKGKAWLASSFQPGVLYRNVTPDWYESVKTGKGAKFTDPEFLAAVNELGELIKLGIFNEDCNSIEAPQAKSQYYCTGQSAMFISGSYELGGFLNEASQEIQDATEFHAIPAHAGDEKSNEWAAGGSGWGWYISAHAKGAELEAALRFLKAMTGEDNQRKILDNGGEPTIKVTASDPNAMNPMVKRYFDYKSTVSMVGCPEIQLNANYMDASYTGYQEFYIGSVTAEDLAKSLQATME